MKAAREKTQVTYKGKSLGVTADVSIGTLKARRAWSSAIQVLRDSDGQLILICPENLSVIVEGGWKTFYNINSPSTPIYTWLISLYYI